LPARHFTQAVTEESIGDHRELLAGLGEIGDSRFHTGAAGSGDGDVELVLRGVNVAQQRANLIHHFEKERVQMAHHGLRHGLINTRRHHARSGAEKKALRGLERRVKLRHQRLV
jgi:hypothetical protein